MAGPKTLARKAARFKARFCGKLSALLDQADEHRHFAGEGLPDVPLSEKWRHELARSTRVEETAGLLRSLC